MVPLVGRCIPQVAQDAANFIADGQATQLVVVRCRRYSDDICVALWEWGREEDGLPRYGLHSGI